MLLAAAALLAMSAQSQEVSFEGHGGLVLKGTLQLPAGTGPVPALLLLPGSGPTDRDGNQLAVGLKTDLLKQIADALRDAGVATLRFDKRATPGYRSDWPKEPAKTGGFFGWDRFVGDATAAYRFLKSQPGVDPHRVGVLGHSEGALIALQIGSDLEKTDERPTSLVLIGGSARRLDEVLMDQLRSKLPQQLPAEEVSKGLAYSEAAIAAIKSGQPVPPDAPAYLLPVFNPSAIPLLKSYFTIEPIHLAKAYSGDALVMVGEFDNQVLADKDAKPLYEALATRPTGRQKFVVVKGAGHNLKETKRLEDNVFEGPVVSEALAALKEWAQAHLLVQN